ncbi:MAG: hypothetical protein ACOX6P_10690 [Candidatus Merdivicinus sp.]
MKRFGILNPVTLAVGGLLLGGISRLLDIYTQNLGNIFSQMAVWILLGTLISRYSRTAWQAMANILTFCLGMLLSYYAAAVLTSGVYSKVMIVGWTAFALCSPILAVFAWMSARPGIFPKLISVGIVAVSVASSFLLFDGFRFYDWILNGLLVYFLFFHKRKYSYCSNSKPKE